MALLAFLIQGAGDSGEGFLDDSFISSFLKPVFDYENVLSQVKRSPYHFATEVVLVAFIIYILLAKRSYDPQKK